MTMSSNEKYSFEKPAMSLSSTEAWIPIREARVKQALEEDDLGLLREISALPGGFGSDDMRRKVWPVLLRTDSFFRKPGNFSSPLEAQRPTMPEAAVGEEDGVPTHTPEAGPSSLPAHKDEAQVKLDTRRSFVTYPRGLRSEGKAKLQEDLHDLIVGVLRRYPALSYFQGYHDILSVLYLTFIPPDLTPPPRSRSVSRNRLRRRKSSQGAGDREKDGSGFGTPEEKGTPRLDAQSPEDGPPPYDAIGRDTEGWKELRRCAEAVSLNRVRDAMGTGMEGMMGLLRILKRILRAADPELSRFSALISPVPTLPFFALSWVLTLFSHDCDSLEPVQRMFDFLLARNPISAVYLAAAILIAKKPQMFDMAKKLGSEYTDDPSLLHPLFVRLPPLYPDTPSAPSPPPSTAQPTTLDREFENEPNPYKPIRLSELFALTDTLMVQYPWDGKVVVGLDIMGEGSVVRSYDDEMGEKWTPERAIGMMEKEVVKPGAGMVDDEEEEEEATPLSNRRMPVPRLPRNKYGTALAVGVVLVGVGIAMYGVRAGGPEASWGRWWALVVQGWVGKQGAQSMAEVTRLWSGILGTVGRPLKDLL